jgi:phosphatidylglycerophosphate synthase
VFVDETPWRLALVGIATMSDYVDGWLARRRKVFSRLGALIDAGTDRAFVVTAVATLAWEGAVSSRDVAVFLSRDLATAVAFMATRFVPSLRNITFVARFPGKVVTVLQLLALTVAIATPHRFDALIAVLAAASVIAIVDYAWALWGARAR